MPSFEGQTIAGRYKLEKMVGEGATATIWRARHVQLDKPVAVKFIHAEGRDSVAVADRFLREARIAAAIHHRMVVEVLDFGTMDNGQPFMVMEYLIGIPLDQRLAQEPKLGDAEILRIADLALSGLAAIHDAGIVHRDIKPANIFLVEDVDGYFPKLLDFGISKAVGPAHLQSALTTKSGWLFGTPRYMSPEQARGMIDIDQRADIYSVGVVIYEALTGVLPYNAEHMGDLLMRITSGGASPMLSVRPDLGPMLSAVIERAMAVKRDDRYSDARAMRGDLRAALSSLTPSRRPDSLGLAPQLPEVTGEVLTGRASATPTMALGETTPAFVAARSQSVPQPIVPATPADGTMSRSLERKHVRWAVGAAAAGVLLAVAWAVFGSKPIPTLTSESGNTSLAGERPIAPGQPSIPGPSRAHPAFSGAPAPRSTTPALAAAPNATDAAPADPGSQATGSDSAQDAGLPTDASRIDHDASRRTPTSTRTKKGAGRLIRDPGF